MEDIRCVHFECASANPLCAWIEESKPGNKDESRFTSLISPSVIKGRLPADECSVRQKYKRFQIHTSQKVGYPGWTLQPSPVTDRILRTLNGATRSCGNQYEDVSSTIYVTHSTAHLHRLPRKREARTTDLPRSSRHKSTRWWRWQSSSRRLHSTSTACRKQFATATQS